MLIVDGMSVLKTTAGGAAFLTNGFAYNFFTQLTAMYKRFPDLKGTIVCWEGGHGGRTQIYSGYKADRKGSGPEIKAQRDLVQDLLHHVGADQVYAPGHEADDCAAWLVNNLGVPALMMSNDNDWLQLVRKGVSIYQKSDYNPQKKGARLEITRETFQALTGYASPEMLLEGKCLMGDGVDGIPGIEGIGPTIAKAYLLGQHVSANRREKIEDFINSQEYSRNKMLMDLITPRDLNLVWRRGEASEERARDFLTNVGGTGWPSVMKNFPDWWELYAAARL